MAEVQQAPGEAQAAAPALPDYLVSPNAVFDDDVEWRYGQRPDYSKTRKEWEDTKTMNHTAGSLPQLVENLVKNWEVEASYKPRLSDWRTIDHKNYSFAINGGPPQTAEHMIKVGTYNGIIAPNEYYSPENQDFTSSHKTFKRMMPTFAWEVLEVYSGPPKVAFKWRHWGTMQNDYVGFNNKGEKVTAKAHGGPIDIQGITVATVDDKVRLQSVDTYMDSLEMFRQIAPGGIVNKEPANHDVAHDGAEQPHDTTSATSTSHTTPQSNMTTTSSTKHISTSTSQAADAYVPYQGAAHPEAGANIPITHPPSNYSTAPHAQADPQPGLHPSSSTIDRATSTPAPHATYDDIDDFLAQPASTVHPHRKDVEASVRPAAGEAVAASAESAEARETYEEMRNMSAGECPFLMNRE